MSSTKNKTILITGSTDGIGKQTALELAEMGANVIIHGRDTERTQNAYEQIKNITGNNSLDFLVADFSSLDEVKRLSEDIHKKYNKLDILINNAGVYELEKKMMTDGFEKTFAVNHLAHFLLTQLVLDLIKKSDNARIINVASMAHSSELDFENLHGDKYYDADTAYSYSKLCNIMFTYHLDKELENTKVSTNCLHPGVIDTKLLRAGWGLGGASLKDGSRTSVYLAASTEVENISGKYFVNCRQEKSALISYDKKVQENLWEISKDHVENFN